MITQAQLMAMFQYEPDTGNFIRLIKKGWAAAGSIAGSVNGKGYVSIEIEEHGYLAHRLACEAKRKIHSFAA